MVDIADDLDLDLPRELQPLTVSTGSGSGSRRSSTDVNMNAAARMAANAISSSSSALPVAANGFLYGEIAPVFDIVLDVKEFVSTPATISTSASSKNDSKDSVQDDGAISVSGDASSVAAPTGAGMNSSTQPGQAPGQAVLGELAPADRLKVARYLANQDELEVLVLQKSTTWK